MFSEITLTRTFSRSVRGQKNQRGITLMLVLFILIVVSLLAAAMARLNQGGSNAVSMEVQSTRALFAAESGAQMMAIRIFPIDIANEVNAACPAQQINDFNAAGLTGCRATVDCARTQTAGRTIFTITSVGQCGIGTNDYARRRIMVGLRSL